MVGNIAGPAIERMRRDLDALFSDRSIMGDLELPRVTVDLPATLPEPNHVFVWGTARDFGVVGALSNMTLKITYHIWVTVIATASTAADASRIANAYQAVALQIAMCDNDLGGTVEEVGVPQVREADAWADSDGRRHAGYLLDFEVSTYVAPSDDVAAIIHKETNNGNG